MNCASTKSDLLSAMKSNCFAFIEITLDLGNR